MRGARKCAFPDATRESGNGVSDPGVSRVAGRTAPFSKSIVVSSSRAAMPELFMVGGRDPSMICSAPSQLYTSGWTSIVATPSRERDAPEMGQRARANAGRSGQGNARSLERVRHSANHAPGPMTGADSH
jgi:hypothetical protein